MIFLYTLSTFPIIFDDFYSLAMMRLLHAMLFLSYFLKCALLFLLRSDMSPGLLKCFPCLNRGSPDLLSALSLLFRALRACRASFPDFFILLTVDAQCDFIIAGTQNTSFRPR